MEPVRPPPSKARVFVFLSVLVGLVLGLFGALHGKELSAWAILSSLLQVLKMFVPSPDVVMNAEAHWALRIAAVICGLSGFVAVFVVWLHSIGRSIEGLYTQYLRRNHMIVYGEGVLLDGLMPVLRTASLRPVRFWPQTPMLHHPEMHVKTAGTLEDLVSRAGLNRARTVVVDCGDDALTLSRAKPILAHLRKTPGAMVRDIAVAVSDPVISDHMFEIIRRHDLAKQHRIVAFDASSALARSSLAEDPLFLRAQERQQTRVHALIVGFGALGERLLDQVMLTSLAGDLDIPRVTVIDRDADDVRRSFVARRPAVLDQFDIDFIPMEIGHDPLEGQASSDALERLARREQDVPFTGILLALGRQSDVMRSALLIDRARERTGRFLAPIWYRCRLEGDAEDLLQGDRPPLTADHGFIRMSLRPKVMIDTIMGHPLSEPLARRLHERYRRGQNVTPDADRPWTELAETYRRANIRTADHMPAKLWSIGVSMKGDLAKWTPTAADKVILRKVLEAPEDDPGLLRLTRIEHDRWMIDRRLDGWRPGTPRDNLRRIHPLLVPYEALRKQPDEIRKDIEQIRETLRFVMDLGEERR